MLGFNYDAKCVNIRVFMLFATGARMVLDKSWFSEIYPDNGAAFSIKIKEKLHSEESAFQTIDIYATEHYGHLMVLGGCVMVTDLDNAIYHEMLSHPALFTHKQPENVAIIGGGDCGTLKEVLKHTCVKQATQIEIDQRVVELSKQYFPSLTECTSDKRAILLYEDGVKWMQRARDIDVLMVDSTDPIGPAAALFSEQFYKSCHAALRPGGILVQQSESPLYHMHIIKPMLQSLRRAGFVQTLTLNFFLSTYPSGWWSATLATKDHSVDLTQFREATARAKSFETFYYNADIHRAAMAAPEFFKRELASLDQTK